MTLSSKIHVWTAVVTTNTQAVFPVWRLYYLLCRTILELIRHCTIYALIRLTKSIRAQHDTVSISKRHSAPLTFEDRVQESTSTPDCFNFDRRFSCAMWSAWYSMSYCRTSKVTRYGALNIEENIRGIVRQTFGIHYFPPPLPLPPPPRSPDSGSIYTGYCTAHSDAVAFWKSTVQCDKCPIFGGKTQKRKSTSERGIWETLRSGTSSLCSTHVIMRRILLRSVSRN